MARTWKQSLHFSTRGVYEAVFLPRSSASSSLRICLQGLWKGRLFVNSFWPSWQYVKSHFPIAKWYLRREKRMWWCYIYLVERKMTSLFLHKQNIPLRRARKNLWIEIESGHSAFPYSPLEVITQALCFYCFYSTCHSSLYFSSSSSATFLAFFFRVIILPLFIFECISCALSLFLHQFLLHLIFCTQRCAMYMYEIKLNGSIQI